MTTHLDAPDASEQDIQPADPGASPRARRAERWLIASMILWWWFVTGQSYFRNDDWLQFQHAAREGLTLEYLRLDVFSHFAPINRFLHWVIQAAAPTDYTVGRLVMVGVLVLQLVAIRWLLGALGVNAGRRLFCLALYGFGLGTMRLALVTDALFHIVMATAVTTFSVGLFLLWEQRGRARYLVGSWATFGVALLTQERPLLIIGFTGLLHFLVCNEIPLRELPRRVVRDLWIWVPFGAVAAVHLGYYFSNHYISQPSPRTVDVLNYWWLLFTGLPTSWVGLWPGVPSGLIGSLASLLARLVCFAAFVWVVRWTIRRHSWNWRPWLWWTICGFVSVTMVGMGRLGLWASSGPQRVAGDLQYSFDLVVLLFFVVALLKPDGGAPLGLWDELTSTARRRSGLKVLAGVCSITLIVGYVAMWGRYDNYRYAGRWMEQVKAEMAPYEDRRFLPFDLVQHRVPDNLMQGFWAPDNRVDKVFDVRPDWPAPNGGSSDRRVFNTEGVPVPVQGRLLSRVNLADLWRADAVRLDGATGNVEADEDDLCLDVGPSTAIEWNLPRAIRSDSMVLDLSYTADTTTASDLVVSGDRRLPAVPEPTGLSFPAEAAGATHVMEVGRVETVRLERFAPARLCLRDAALVMPIYPAGTDTGAPRKQGGLGVIGECRTVGLDGRPGVITECGESWPAGGPRRAGSP